MALTGHGTRTKTTVRYDNSATLCASLCKASQYIFSGTKVLSLALDHQNFEFHTLSPGQLTP